METTAMPLPARRSIGGRVFDFLSGFGLATVLLLLLGVLTWLATLEQVDNGLYPTLDKYFNWKAFYLIPEINGKSLFVPLPGGYWVSAVLLVNLILGGVIRMRRGWRHIGNLVAHCGIILMLIGAGVAHHFSERGNMAIAEGQTNSAAEDYLEYTVEIAEIKDGRPDKVHVIRGKDLDDLESKQRVFHLPNLPFDLEISGYLRDAKAKPAAAVPDADPSRIADGYVLTEIPKTTPPKDAQEFAAGCYSRVLRRDGTKSDPFILLGNSYEPFTYKEGDKVFTIDLRKRVWAMPFSLKLNKFTADFHPGTSVASRFVSKVTRIENNASADYTIRMNEPMRYEGLTFYQASYFKAGSPPNERMYSVFEIVRNPADQWPKYSLIIVAIGLGLTFLIKLVTFLEASLRKQRHEQ